MSKTIQILIRLAFVLVVIVIGNYVIVAQTTLTGDWKGHLDSSAETHRRSEQMVRIELQILRG